MQNMATCPHCGGKFSFLIEIHDNRSLVEKVLLDELYRYVRGLEPYGYIEKKDLDLYEFNVQISDSPEGDTWAYGIVFWCPPYKFEIKELNYRRV